MSSFQNQEEREFSKKAMILNQVRTFLILSLYIGDLNYFSIISDSVLFVCFLCSEVFSCEPY